MSSRAGLLPMDDSSFVDGGGVGHSIPSSSVSSTSGISSSFASSRSPPRAVPHSQDTIRLSTMELSGITFSDGMASTPRSFNSFGDLEVTSVRRMGETGGELEGSGTPYRSGLSLMRPHQEEEEEQREQRQEEEEQESAEPSGSPTPMPTRVPSPSHSPSARRVHHHQQQPKPDLSTRPTPERRTTIRWDPELHGDVPDERTPLLSTPTPPPNNNNNSNTSSTKSLYTRLQTHLSTLPSTVLHELPHIPKYLPAVLLGSLLNILDGVSYGMIIFPSSLPFVGLGPMGVSMFFVSCFVAQMVYSLGGKFAGSGFAGANGSMMIEVVPFFHILASSIAIQLYPGDIDDPEAGGWDQYPGLGKQVIATTIVAYALSSVLTGLAFFLLGFLKLGSIIGFFPRHILVGCIGGVGVFLLETGLTVSLRIPDDDFSYSLSTLRLLFGSSFTTFAQWALPLLLAVLLRVITTLIGRLGSGARVARWNQLVFPVYFVIIPILFYIVVFAGRMDLNKLRKDGWFFDLTPPGSAPSEGPGFSGGAGGDHWYAFYEYFDLSLIHWAPLWATLPTQFALLFFNILHPPLNVPALSVSLNEDVDTDRELVSHGYSNLLAGVLGSVPNYLVYVNTLLFYRVGGTTRISGFLLAIATLGLLMMGTGPIAYIPIPVVSALIFVLGIDLVKEALWDTRHRVNRTEYITIASIMVAMTVWDFVKGVLWGIVVSCFFFVVSNSQRRSIRALHTGDTAMSTVRRPSSQRAYIQEVSKQTTILRLQGYLFFGTITQVENAIRALISPPPGTSSWPRHPIRFLVLDLTLVYGVDMSAAEAFVRIQRLLAARYVTLVFCGIDADADNVGRALRSVDVLNMEGVELFRTFGDAMEWTENAYLRAWFRSLGVRNLKEGHVGVGVEVGPGLLPEGNGSIGLLQDADAGLVEEEGDEDDFSALGSPRREHLANAANNTLVSDLLSQSGPIAREEPYPTLIRCFSSFEDFSVEKLEPLIPYLKRMSLPTKTVLWKQGDTPDGLYLIEAGMLRASYKFSHSTYPLASLLTGTSNGSSSENSTLVEDGIFNSGIDESMVPGVLAGELTALSGLPRNATVIVERDAVLWKLTSEGLRELEEREPRVAREFTRLVVKSAKIDYDTLLSALATRQ